jgi:hypothetical protein
LLKSLIRRLIIDSRPDVEALHARVVSSIAMFYDLNVRWTPNDAQLPRTLAFLSELGYNVVALNHVISGKLPVDVVRRNQLMHFPPSRTK